ncbi:MAG: aldehyde dehydrogenase family protein [Thaumarchaeota archaeon]|nr:aldehyde dehydrogenase family protein [Nitrososphaerota archaeon]
MPENTVKSLGDLLSGTFEPLFKKGSDGIPLFNMYVDGSWSDSSDGATVDVDTPIDRSVIARVPQASERDVERAVASAYDSWQKIRDIPGIERVEIFQQAARLIREHEDNFVNTLMLEAGKPRGDAAGEVHAVIDRLKLVMEEARKIFGEYLPGDWSEDTLGKFALVIREPVGVVAAISPFNYPLFIGATKIIPALLAGNAVVAKPSVENPLSMLLFARILERAGIPAGSLNVLTGSGGKVGEALVSSDKVALVTFTGSTEIGRRVVQAAGVKRLHLELGGKGMALVLDDADLELAAKKCVEGSLKNAGQRCDAISAILVVENVADRFVQLLVDEVDRWKAGDPRDESVKVGPVINMAAAERIHGLVEDAVEKGAMLLRGGRHRGCVYEPTVLDRVLLTARIAWEETFGPVATVIRVRDEDEAITVGKESRYGLDSCVFTNSFYRMWKMAKRLQVGEVTINDLPKHGVGYFPFGGSKESGVGREGIGYSIDEMTNLKTIVFNIEPAKLGKTHRIHQT